jgi:hypothetical protein
MTTEKSTDDALVDMRYAICPKCSNIYQVPDPEVACVCEIDGSPIFEARHIFKQAGQAKVDGALGAYEMMCGLMEVLQNGLEKIRDSEDADDVQD